MAKAGGKKDATYLAKLFYPHIEQLGKKNVDLIIFDGTKNVQKAGNVVESKYLRVSCIHGGV